MDQDSKEERLKRVQVRLVYLHGAMQRARVNSGYADLALTLKDEITDREKRAFDAGWDYATKLALGLVQVHFVLTPKTFPPSSGEGSPVHFRELLSQEVTRARRYKLPLTLVRGYIDNPGQLDDKAFKSIEVLTRETDGFCKVGESDFAILLTHTEQRHANALCYRLRERIEKPQTPGDIPSVSVTFGVVEYQAPESSDVFIKRADQALHRAKNDDGPNDGLLGVPVRV